MLSHLRLLLACGVVSTICGVSGGVIGAKLIHPRPVKDLSLRKLQLLDEQGRTRATLAMNSEGEPAFDFLSEAGQPTVTLGTGKEGGILHMTGSGSWAAADLGFIEGEPFLGFSGDGREGRVIVGYTHDDDTIPSTTGHWGLSVTGYNQQYLALGIAMLNGREYDTYAVLPEKHEFRLPGVSKN